jgi:hypothetical protein
MLEPCPAQDHAPGRTGYGCVVRRLMALTVVALAALTGVASAKSTATLTYTLEYTGSYSFHRDSTQSGSSASTDEHFTWSYRGEATLDASKATGYQVLPLHGSVAIAGSDDAVTSTTSRQCTLAPTRGDEPPGNFAVQSGLPASFGVFLPESFVTSTNCPEPIGVECMPGNCADICLSGPPSTTANGGDPDPVWAPSFGPFKGDELFAYSRQVDMRPGAGTASNDSCYGGSEHEQLDVKSHVAFGVSWGGPTFFVDFPDGAPPNFQQPGTPLKPGKSPQTTPTASIPPKVPLPPTGPEVGTPLVPGIGIGCPATVKKCPTTITVTDGNKKLASATVTVKRGTVGLAGLKLKHLSLKSGASKKVKVAVAVRTGKTVHRGSRKVTLTRARS